MILVYTQLFVNWLLFIQRSYAKLQSFTQNLYVLLHHLIAKHL